jgi:general secretion pathway protein F
MRDFEARILRQGTIQTLQISAQSDAEARQRLQAEGARVLSLRTRMSSLRRRQKFALGLFIQELVVLLDAGLTLVEAIETLREKAARGIAQTVLNELLDAMYQGQTFSKALALRPAVFPPLLVATAASSEHSGQLATALRRYHHYEAHLETVRKRVSGALMYPAIVLSIGGLILLFLLFFVIPRFSTVFSSMSNLPVTARFMVWWGDLVSRHGLELAVGITAVTLLLFLLFRTAAFKQWLTGLLWTIPRLREQRNLFVLARLYRTMGMLLSGGMPIVSAFELAGNMLPIERRADLHGALNAIKSGKPMSSTLTTFHLTTSVSERLLRVGEKSGEIAAMCERIAQFHDEELERAIEMFSKVFEPILMLVVGSLIGLIVFLLYMPIFELAGSIEG